MAKKEDKRLTISDLMAKYGDVKVMGVPASLVEPYLFGCYTPAAEACAEEGKITTPLIMKINHELIPMFRREAELDPAFKQVIPYVVITDSNGRVFTTHRLAGDDRLVGGYSIGTGGHIDDGETIYEGMYRELREEVGIEQNNIFSVRACGFIMDSKSAVNSVHLGIVFHLVVIDPSVVACLEKDKLEGEWMNASALKKLNNDGKLESWSEIAFKNAEIGGNILWAI